MTRSERILCPFCGGEMSMWIARGRVLGVWKDYYDAHARCTECAAQGPFARASTRDKAIKAAAAAALRRHTPPAKPLTLEEAYGADHCYLEHDAKGTCEPRIVSLGMMQINARNQSCVEILEFGEDEIWCDVIECAEYGRTWRCWARMPSKEERRTAKWENER